jgi:hypothetical protein
MARNARQLKNAESFDACEEEALAKRRLEHLLWEARQEFLRSGEPMLDENGLKREIAERRGGVSEEN